MTQSPLLADLHSTVANALAEDIGDGDITARLIPENQISQSAGYLPGKRCCLRHSLGY